MLRFSHITVLFLRRLLYLQQPTFGQDLSPSRFNHIAHVSELAIPKAVLSRRKGRYERPSGTARIARRSRNSGPHDTAATYDAILRVLRHAE